MKCLMIFTVLLLASCANFKGPSQSPAKMSADTLCYRAAYAKNNEAIHDEIAARRLNCRKLLDQQGAIGSGPVGGPVAGPSY
ncbi:MAG: hypothetical protein LRZ85_00620 [Alphaproteobacteria bacterium]|nr:hypothetical protein [Alphaproteobacteria bacterium]MCD8519907.1 hypothetical protein [Alphaproteobacteria bacterium]MCD8570886.1 hypothetical protein [Alphaproteobacteria bacterium]